MDEKELEILYMQQVNEELVLQTRTNINQIVENYPHDFGLDSLFANTNIIPTTAATAMPEKLAQLYQEICEQYNTNTITFDHIWVG
jgi:hypothetical protein